MSSLTPPNPSRWPSLRAIAAIVALAISLGSAWMLWRTHPDEPARPAADTVPSTPEVALPAPVDVPAPIGTDAIAPISAPSAAYEPTPASDNPDLSLARRAGLHRSANPLRLTASVALALDAGTGEVLHARNDLAILPIASLTKLMTAMVLLDAHLPLSQKIRITHDDVDTLRHSRSRLRVGTTLTRRQALKLALMSSENRAAHALARSYPGGVPALVVQMNRKAAELGMTHSRFVDPTGLSNQNRATAQDVAKLVLAASEHPLVRSYSTTKRHLAVFGRSRLQYLNSNRLVRQSGWPITLQKTGYIVEAGHCVAMLTRTSGQPLVLVVMDAGSLNTRTVDLRKMRHWAARQIAKAAKTPPR
jgi:serine-type D-Ala-D-Ala endopeptidase (penicillin-binding protein 7)